MNKKNADDETWDTVITPARGWFAFGVAETWRYRDLVMVLVNRDFVSVYKQTILGPLWFIIQPLATTLVFVVLFGNIAHLPTAGTPPFLFYLSGIVMWNFFATNFSKTSDVFVSNAGIFSKVYFPRLVVPVATVISNLLTFAIQFLLFYLFAAFLVGIGRATMVRALMLTIPLLFYTGLLGLGVGIAVSALTTRFRDLGYLNTFVLQLWMYATPVIYPASLLPARWKIISIINPMAAPVETFRHIWLGTPAADPLLWEAGSVITAILLVLGLMLFSHTQRVAMDTV